MQILYHDKDKTLLEMCIRLFLFCYNPQRSQPSLRVALHVDNYKEFKC